MVIFSFCSNLNRTSYKRTVETLIRYRVMWRYVAPDLGLLFYHKVFTVCQNAQYIRGVLGLQ